VVQGILGGKADDTEQNVHTYNDGVVPFEEAYDYALHAKDPTIRIPGVKPCIVDNLPDDVLLMRK
jgi:hypothetical protein